MSDVERGEIVSDGSKTGDEYPEASRSRTGSKRSISEMGRSDDGDGPDAGDGGNDNELDDIELDPEKRREDRKLRRVMANRKSARESRERRKKLLADLQESVESLTTENSSLTTENISLRQELAALIEQSGGTAPVNIMSNLQTSPSAS
mmetsp:Transcript_22127/g.61559  ORF Transcript_22127/g.61559 Transcript_22127/m.61559 type:complete len:149 (-) Transcript_22127:287-733(-)|eukprot:CAMPEP_0198116272 /NCGR_PEP_ID=MMETSP1442-20131203/10772_1 /TAXON_ID= /ORGANISM="Craspedostauros australis, Strain CCMP3328" /LENGTH=148 /DNA_ID=CAMNT_0043774049 /DNA_START=307 /DNA_END=753 /DNA_ORIENTATION=-